MESRGYVPVAPWRCFNFNFQLAPSAQADLQPVSDFGEMQAARCGPRPVTRPQGARTRTQRAVAYLRKDAFPGNESRWLAASLHSPRLQPNRGTARLTAPAKNPVSLSALTPDRVPRGSETFRHQPVSLLAWLADSAGEVGQTTAHLDSSSAAALPGGA